MSVNDFFCGFEEGVLECKICEKLSQEQIDWSGLFSVYLESYCVSLVDSLCWLFGYLFGSFFICLVMGIILSLLMGFLLLLNNVEWFGGFWQWVVQIFLFFDLKISENQGQDLCEQIECLLDVIEV